MSSIAENLERVRAEIADACVQARRDPATVALMAVSKTHPAEAVLEAMAAGQRLFGENRVQEFAGKLPGVADGLHGAKLPEFHLIGPLQNNKTGKAAELFDGVDAVDEVKTVQRLDTAAGALGKVLRVLVEVKLSHEDSKHGLAPEGLTAFLEAVAGLQHVRVTGLMTVPPFFEDAERARPYFARLRELREAHVGAHPGLVELSMGMSHDFRVAIAEGSTCVRVGTAIFGARSYPV